MNSGRLFINTNFQSEGDMADKVSIIGAGIAGLSAGCYLQMNGYETEIYELNSVPGGLCCAWKRNDFTIEGCVHWLVGSSPRDNFYHLWNELLDMKKLQFVDPDIYMRIEDAEGGSITVYTNIDKFEREMLKNGPEDMNLIKDFTDAVRKFTSFKMPLDKAPELYDVMDTGKLLVSMTPYLMAAKKWLKMTAAEYSAKFKNPLLRKTFEHLFLPEMSVFFLVMTLAWMHNRSAGYPVGGSYKFARLIEKRYKDLGGKISYDSKVAKIITEKGAATGLVLDNGKKVLSNTVISAADGYYTIFKMLEGKYIDNKLKKMYDDCKIFPSYVQVSLGVNREFAEAPSVVLFPVKKPLIVDKTAVFNDVSFRIFNFDPTLSPKKSTLITCTLPTYDYEHWVNLKKSDRTTYSAEKSRIANQVTEAFESRFGEIKTKVKMVDVSTPATVIRYTNNWKGSLEGWLLTPEVGLKQLPGALPGLKNFYMAGQWVTPGGGLPTALLSGRNTAQVICKKDGIKFTTKSF